MKIKNRLAAILVILFTTSNARTADAPSSPSEFKAIITAIDDSGFPVSSADIGFSWGWVGGQGSDTGHTRKMADTNGVAEFTGITRYNTYAYGAVKHGYYPSRGAIGEFLSASAGHWQPWPQPLVVTLKLIRKPVPMYARTIAAFLPVSGEPCGYDLEAGDWTSPYGNGKHADFEFTGEGKVESDRNYSGTLKLRLPGEANGIQAYDYHGADLYSDLKMPCEAPMTDYASSWTWKTARVTENKPDTTSSFVDESNPQRGFIFRVRSVRDVQGNVVRANYGKIHGPVKFTPKLTGKWHLVFTYYFNPDGTRNLEFDPKHNLFTNLKSDEQVQTP